MSGISRTIMIMVAAMLGSFAVSTPAGATSCIAPAGPKATITGNDDRSMGGKFFDMYDGVVLGEVASVDANPRMAPGGTKIHVDVYGAIGTSTVGQTIVISADDDGAMNGFPFQAGTWYFIPVQDKGPQGQVNYSFVCDPIAQIKGEAAADKLLDLARRNGQDVALAGGSSQPTEPSAAPAAAATGDSWPVVPVAVGVAVAAGLGIAAAVVLRRRRAHP